MREGWELKKLKVVCKLINGRAYKKPELLSDGKYPVLRVGNLFTNKQWYYSDLELNEDKYCDFGDLIYAWSASFGPRIWEGEKVIYHYHIWKVLPNIELIDKDYLFHLFEWDKEMIKEEHGTGTTMMHVGKSSMENRSVPLPPLSEQKQIVEILDQAFAAIDQAKANIEKNIQNAKELFQSKLNEIFSQKGDGWEEKTLGEVCSLYQGLAINKKTKHLLVEKSTLPLLRIKDLRNNSHEQYVAESGFPINALVKKEQIIYTRTGNSLGLVFRGRTGVLHNNSFKVIPHESLSNDYLFWWLQHEAFTSKIFALASKAAQPDISHKLFKEEPISIPSLEQQTKYYSIISILDKSTKELVLMYKTKCSDLKELKKSILQKAFAGELTENEIVV